MDKLIYLDNAATTKTSPEVVEAMLPYFTEHYGNPSSIYSFAAANKEVISKQRETIAGVIGAKENEIYFTAGGTEAEATGLNVQRYLSGSQGGDQQIAARISCNEIDLLLFFRDPISVKPHEPNDMNLLRLCDVHNIPVATNIATAEALIHALERGDLDWRDIVNPTKI